MKDLIEALNRAHKLDEAAAGVATKRTGIIPGTIYKVMIKGADEFLLTERFTDIQEYLSNYASGCPSFNAVIYTMTNFRFKDIPYLYYEGGSYLNIDFSDSTAQSVIYVDGECKTQLNSENYSTPASSHLSDYTVRLSNTVTDFNDSLLVSPRLESFKYKVVIDSVIHLFDTKQEAQDYYDQSPSSRRLGNKFESFADGNAEADFLDTSMLKEEVELPPNVYVYDWDLERINDVGKDCLYDLGRSIPDSSYTLDDYFYQPTNKGKRLVMLIKIDGGEKNIVLMETGRFSDMDELYENRYEEAKYFFDAMRSQLNDIADVDSFISAITRANNRAKELDKQIVLQDVEDIAEYIIDCIEKYPEEHKKYQDRARLVDLIIDYISDYKHGYYSSRYIWDDWAPELTDEAANTIANKVCDLIMPRVEALYRLD